MNEPTVELHKGIVFIKPRVHPEDARKLKVRWTKVGAVGELVEPLPCQGRDIADSSSVSPANEI